MGGVRECQTGGVLTNWRERMRVRAESKKQGHVDFRVRGLDRVYTRAIVSFMSNTRCVAITYINSNGHVSQTWFCFERSALKFAQEEGLTSFVVSINLDRILFSQSVSNPIQFITRTAAA